MKTNTHKDLDVWKLGIELLQKIYEATKRFPSEELYALTSQLRRSAVSIPSNIAEGYARESKREQIHYLYISLGSLSELETQLIISVKLNYLSKDSLLNVIEEIRRKLLNLIKYHKSQV